MTGVQPLITEELCVRSEYCEYNDCALIYFEREEENEFKPIEIYYTLSDKKRTELDKARQDEIIFGGCFIMSIVLNDLFEDGLNPKQIYEICMIEGAYKKYLIQNLPQGYERCVFISDRFFDNLNGVTNFLECLPSPLEMVIVDINDISYLDYIKDYEMLREELKRFYECIQRMSKLGTICIIFVNHSHYHSIHDGNSFPDVIKIHIYPTNIQHSWEAQISSPPELKSRRSLFNIFVDDIPFICRL